MSFNTVTASERVHIAFFGMRNAGKSSLVNAVTGQTVSVVSEVKGTTTDPVKKAMELLPLGPVEIIDTPGFDDVGDLGEMRVARAREVLRRTDLAVLAVDSTIGICEADRQLMALFKEKEIPYVIAMTKSDLADSKQKAYDMVSEKDSGTAESSFGTGTGTAPIVYTSAAAGEGIHALKETLAHMKKVGSEKILLRDLLEVGDIVVLVMPQDEAAPKARLILPQQMMVREVLDAHAIPVGCQTEELAETLQILGKKPRLVITDSQAFKDVAPVVPGDVLLTSFSILMARYKGELDQLIGGVKKLGEIRKAAQEMAQHAEEAEITGEAGADKTSRPRILISEGCSHHRQCGDIGTVKLPKLVKLFTGTEPEFMFTSGGEFPENLKDYDLVIHCGACMLNEKEMHSRLKMAADAGVPIVNYGIAIAYMRGILERSLELFPEVLDALKKMR